jgi:hypothetical protein
MLPRGLYSPLALLPRTSCRFARALYCRPWRLKNFSPIYRYARAMSELPIIQKTHDLIQWYVPVLNRLPRDHKFMLGDRIITGLYDLLEGGIRPG